MKRKCILLSLLAVFLFSCHNESSEFIPEKDPEITQLEQKYGVNFKKITDETDTLNSIFIPFEDIEQLLEENIISRSMPTRKTYTGYGSLGFGSTCKITFDNIKIGQYYFSFEFNGGINSRYFLSDFITFNSYLNIFTYTSKIFSTKLYHITTSEYSNSRMNIEGKFNMNIDTYVGNTRYQLSGTVEFNLDIPAYTHSNFSAKLTLTCYF